MPIHRLSLLAVLFASTLLATAASAVPITTPPGLGPGDRYRLAFVTSSPVAAGTNPNIGFYNSRVSGAANVVTELRSLDTTWKAIASTSSVDARDNTGTTPNGGAGVPIYLLDGSLLAINNDDLWDGSIRVPLAVDERGSRTSADVVRTGTLRDGRRHPSWVLGTYVPIVGWSHRNDRTWVSSSPGPTASTASRLYGMSDVITVIPEPETALLVGLGLAGLAARRL